jgi:erythromycin esterase-like protein
VARIGDADIVMLGESTHGTHEFYRERSRITERLIRDEGFTAMAIEGEWADARRVHRFIAGQGTDRTAAAALSGFDRFPRWMWANAEIRDLVGRLRRARTEAGRGAGAVGFYGLDVQEPGPRWRRWCAISERSTHGLPSRPDAATPASPASAR